MNPTAEAEAQRQDKLALLQQECSRLQERVRVLEEGQSQDVTQTVNMRLASSNTLEVQGNIVFCCGTLLMQLNKLQYEADLKEG
jgi:hypothetical protein